MKYEFPAINHLNDVREAIDGRDEFIVAEREGFLVVNYLVNLADTFPTPDTKDSDLNRLYILRRECRGLKFYPDGRVAARTLHKFFNVNERPETADHKIDFSQEFVILDKLDGSMLHPLLLDGEVLWSSKMGLTDVAGLVTVFVESSPIKYDDFNRYMISEGLTPTYEWCSRSQRIVVDYPEDQLLLIAIRHNITGAYHLYDDMKKVAKLYGIPVVKAWDGDFEGFSQFLSATADLEDQEGYVIRFATGHMLKCKNSWYVNLHKIKELLNFEKDVIALILREDQDDAKAFMTDEDKAKIDRFTDDLYSEMKATAERLEWVVIAAKDNLNGSKKRFAIEIVLTLPALEKGLLFNIWDGYDPLTVVKKMVLDNTGSSTKVNLIRPLIGGIRWERY